MRKFIRNKKIFFLILFLSFSFFALKISAREVDWPETPLGTPFPDSGINFLVQYVYEWGIALGGIVAFIALIIAGFQYLVSAGNPSLMKEAKNQVIAAGLGLLLLLSSWLILNTINPELTVLRSVFLDPEKIPEIIMGPALEYEGNPCDFAIVYFATEWNEKNGFITLQADEGEATWIPDKFIGSIESFRINEETGIATSCGKSACGCALQLFGGPSWYKILTLCGDKIGEIPAYDKDIHRWVDRKIHCIRLIAPTTD